MASSAGLYTVYAPVSELAQVYRYRWGSAHIQHHIKEIQLSGDRNDTSTELEEGHTNQTRNSGISAKSIAGAGMFLPLQVCGSREPLYLCGGLLLCVLCV